jgi:thioredoxin 1
LKRRSRDEPGVALNQEAFMASQNVMSFSDANFDTEVLASQTPVLVDFWAEWCGPCRMLAPVVDDLAEEYKGRVKVGKLDTDANRNTAMRFSINAIPTVLVFKGGQLVQRLQGLRGKKDFKAALDTALGVGAGV